MLFFGLLQENEGGNMALYVSPKHDSPILFIFAKEMPDGEIIGDIFFHNLRQKYISCFQQHNRDAPNPRGFLKKKKKKKQCPMYGVRDQCP